MALCLHGTWVRFYPADIIAGWRGITLCGCAGLLLHLLVLRKAARAGRLPLLRAQGRGLYRWFLWSAPVAFAFVLWQAVFHSLPWMYTRVLGSPYADAGLMRLDASGSDRLCRWQLREENPPRWQRRLCVDRHFHERHRHHSPLQVRRLGHRSALGSTVNAIEVPGTGGLASEQVSK